MSSDGINFSNFLSSRLRIFFKTNYCLYTFSFSRSILNAVRPTRLYINGADILDAERLGDGKDLSTIDEKKWVASDDDISSPS